MAEKILLKKYANRRLYDTQKSRYVTLNEVAERIRNGQQVKIIDAKNKDDVTAFILTQIVLEEAKNKNVLLPEPLLYMIIRYGDNMLVDFFENYLQQAFKSYLAYKSSMDDQFKKWLDMGLGFSEATLRQFSKSYLKKKKPIKRSLRNNRRHCRSANFAGVMRCLRTETSALQPHNTIASIQYKPCNLGIKGFQNFLRSKQTHMAAVAD
jgi:polyhydroxyalkanoate synthesis repressor PhaR